MRALFSRSTLRAGNYPQTTRYTYLLAAAQLARYLNENATPDLEAEDAAEDPEEIDRSPMERVRQPKTVKS
ncbi:hypothetical protein [Streptomyces asiaticus]|uniref:hypothetical protein n=1 Tax=Streptomyces asiaticus TaxID=114695 RepID=UPI003F6749D0